jgi:2-oxoglutarate dehydrogenase E2 component (dihydrolipoamide succinyltransferase)
VPSPASGYLAEIKVNEGDTVDVGTVLAVLSDQPGGGNGASAPAAEEAEAPQQEEAGTALEAEAAEQESAEAQADAEQSPAAQAPAEAPAPQPAPAPEPEPAAAAPAAAPASDASGLVLSPVVRRLVNEHNIDPASIEGTGAGGRITRADVLRAVEGGGTPSAPAAPAARATPSAPAQPQAPSAVPQPAAQVAVPKPGERDTVVPLNNIRKRTAEHMVRSKATSPHVFTIMEVDFEAVEKARRPVRDEFKQQEGFSLTYLPFIARAMVDALADFPHMNATVGDGELIVHNYVNIGVAVDLNYEGLIVPVIHDAQDKRLRAIAREISDLASRARSKKLSADDISGGTVTITNAGGAGTFANLPVINQPQVMILSTEGVFRKPVVVTDAVGNEAIAIHSVGNLSMGWDHRAFDGAYASAFLRHVCEILETRDWTAEL